MHGLLHHFLKTDHVDDSEKRCEYVRHEEIYSKIDKNIPERKTETAILMYCLPWDECAFNVDLARLYSILISMYVTHCAENVTQNIE